MTRIRTAVNMVGECIEATSITDEGVTRLLSEAQTLDAEVKRLQTRVAELEAAQPLEPA